MLSIKDDSITDLPNWRINFFQSLTNSVTLEGKKILEIGCGDGKIAKLVANKSAPQFVYAIDPYSYYIYPIYEEENLLCLPMNADNLLFPNNYFDVIYSHNVFEHIHNLSQAWNEIKRVLKSGGTFYTHFAPLWTHAYGHHYYNETNDSFDCIFPPYSHLYMNEDQIEELVKANTSLPTELERARSFILGDVCNKLFPSDYRKILLGNEDLKVEEYLEIKQHHHNRPLPQEVLEKHKDVHREDFEISGITFKGTKLVESQINDAEKMREIYKVYAYRNFKNKSLFQRLLEKIKIILLRR